MKRNITAVLIFLGCQAVAQRSKVETVEIGIDQKSLSAVEWPFDLPFYITGAISEDVQSVNFNYRIANPDMRNKKWVSFPHPDNLDVATGYLNNSKTWKRGVGNNAKFIFLCEGLHPNVKYNFRFELIRNVSLDTKTEAEMRSKLANRLEAFFKSKETTAITQAELIAENAALKAVVLSYFPGKKLLFKSDPTKVFYFDAFNMTDVSANLAFVSSTNLHTAKTNYNSAVTDLLDEMALVRNQILEDIDAIQNGKLEINPYSKEVLSLPFNPGLSEFKDYTLLDGLKLLRRLSLPGSHILRMLLNDSLRITNNSFTVTEGKRHPESVLFIATLLEELGNQLIKDTKAGIESPRFAYFSNDMKTALQEIWKYSLEITDAETQFDKIEASLPDILARIVQFEALESDVLPVVDVVSESTPYISAEAGLSYTHSFRYATHYRGANIYFVPIEKRAPLSSFRGHNRILKSLCLQIGVSNFFGDRPQNTRSLLGKEAKTDLNLALGWRLNRIIKLNAGIIPYKTNIKNVLSDNFELKGAGYVSIGLDVNLLKAFGDVATLLSL